MIIKDSWSIKNILLNKVAPILVVITIVWSVVYLLKIRGDKDKEIYKSGIECNCEVQRRGFNIRYFYYYKGELMVTKKWSPPHPSFFSSEIYKCFVDSNNPKDVVVDFCKPVIDTIKYKWDTVSIQKINVVKENRCGFLVNIEYVFGEYIYNRKQYLSESDLNKELKILVRKDNHQISHLITRN